MGISLIDIVFLVIGAYGFWVGYSRGIIQTLLTVFSYLFGIMAAIKFGSAMASILGGIFPGGGSLLLLAGVVLTFVLVMVLFRMIANVLETGLESININFINQIMGGAFSALFFVLVYSVLLMFAARSRLISEEAKLDSLTYESILQPLPERALAAGQQVWPYLTELYDHSLDLLDQLKDGVDTPQEDTIYDIEDEQNGSRPIF